MAEIKVKVVKEFRDRTADLELRKKDTVLTVSEERAKKLIGLGFVEVVKTPNEDKASEATEAELKKRASKKGTESK